MYGQDLGGIFTARRVFKGNWNGEIEEIIMEDIIQKNRICKLNFVYFIIEPELIVNKIDW